MQGTKQNLQCAVATKALFYTGTVFVKLYVFTSLRSFCNLGIFRKSFQSIFMVVHKCYFKRLSRQRWNEKSSVHHIYLLCCKEIHIFWKIQVHDRTRMCVRMFVFLVSETLWMKFLIFSGLHAAVWDRNVFLLFWRIFFRDFPWFVFVVHLFLIHGVFVW